MYNDDEINLTLEERNALASLSREIAPSDLLESRVVKALKSEGHFGGARAQARSSLVTALRIAAAIALFAGGVATGRYILSSKAPQSASVTAPASNAPASQNREAQSIAPRTGTPAVQQNETVVAEREMWF